MRKGATLIIIILGLFYRVNAQEVIIADTLSGCDTLYVSFTLQNAGDLSSYSSVHWDFGDGMTADNSLSTAHLFSDGKFTVTCLLDGTNTITLADKINVRSSPVASFYWKDSTADSEMLRYYFESESVPGAGETYNYFWELPGGTTYTSSSFIQTFDTQGLVEVVHIVSDDMGCSDTLIRNVSVSESLIVANVFTPNGDGRNDYFVVDTNGDITYRFTVFARTGATVYSSESPRIFWDGRTFSGREVPDGVYFYVIESVENNTARISGFIHLFR